MQTILPEEEKIEAKDTQSYFSILFEGKSNRWILRYFDSRQHPSVVFPIELTEDDIFIIERSGLEVSGNQIIIETPENILRLAWLVKESLAFCKDDENFRVKKQAD